MAPRNRQEYIAPQDVLQQELIANLGLLAASLVRFPEEEFARSAVERALVNCPHPAALFGFSAAQAPFPVNFQFRREIFDRIQQADKAFYLPVTKTFIS
ncbi:MAG: hypothetical protein AAGU04_05060 [Anaerolineaceae bacterium]